MSGNCLVVSTAIYTDAIYADKLLSIDLDFGPNGPDNVLRIARIFLAIRKYVNQLRLTYKGLEALPLVVPSVMYPRLTPFSPKVKIPRLGFFSKVGRVDGTPIATDTMAEANRRHAIYLAKAQLNPSTTESTTVFVIYRTLQ